MELAEVGKVRAVPILLRPVTKWNVPPLYGYTAIPKNLRPVTLWTNRDEAFANIVAEIDDVVGEIIEHKQLLATSGTFAPVPTASPFSDRTVLSQEVFHCATEVSPLPVRGTGITELLPDLMLRFHGDPGEQRFADIWIYANTNVTSRLIAGVASEATLSLATSQDSTKLVTLRRGVHAVQSALNALAFLRVPLHELRYLPHGERNFRVTNVRVNGAQLGLSTRTPTQICLFVRVSDTTVTAPQLAVAFMASAVQVTVVSDALDLTTLAQGHSLNIGLLNDQRTADKVTAFVTFRGTLASYEPPSERTRLELEFANIPEGIHLFATTEPVATSPTAVTGALMSTEVSKSPKPPTIDGRVPMGDRSLALSRIQLHARYGVAVWEIQTGASHTETFTVGLVIAYKSDPSNYLPGLGTATVGGSLAPTSSVNVASATAPIPRFAFSSVAQEFFTVVP